ncbi:MAG: ABC transporter ATP-binding protein [Dehalococcoidales bacterium]|nr:ABC transporter ATP-binding protein [Dehalococcoidales bacterium]
MFHGGGGGPPGGPGGRLHGAGDLDEQDVLGSVVDFEIYKRMGKYIGPVKGWMFLGAIGMFLRTVAQLATPYLIKIATDSYIQTGNTTGLGIVALILVGISLVLWGGEYMSILYLTYAGQSMLYRMRNDMFDHLHELSLTFFNHNKVGKLMSRVQNDINQLQEVLTNGVLNMLTSIITLVGIAVIMITMNWQLALLTLVVVPILAIIVFIWQKFARKAFVRVRRAIAEVNDQLQEGISGVRAVQSLSREEENMSQFDNLNREHLNANIQAARLQAFMMPIVQIMTAIAYGLLIIYGGHQVMDGAMQVGVLLAFIMYIQRFFEPIMQLTQQYTMLQRAMASGERIFELLDVEPDITSAPNAIEMPDIKGDIEFDHIRFSYEPGVEVLHDINLKVNPGETIAVVGHTGAGKSSLMNLVPRLFDIDDGQIILDGYDIKSVTLESLRRQVGIVPQDAFLFSGTIEDNIRYGKLDATREEIINAAKAAGVHEAISRMDKGYDTPVGERGGNLSAGQRQLTCLARAILADPPILIMDEATSNVDTNTERIMQDALKRLAKGRTCLIIAHRLSTITSADRIIALDSGRIVESGTHKELLEQEGLYYHMFQTLSAVDS